MKVPINPKTKVGELLDAYPAAEELLISLAPKFKALRNPVLRRTVAKVSSLEQAARVGGLSVKELVSALRDGLGVTGDDIADGADDSTGDAPSWLDEGREPSAELDADALLEAGKTPVAEASVKLAHMQPGDVLLVRATFEPAPLVDALRDKGHAVFADEKGEEAWEVWVRCGE
jgi:TusA-related sulfurtransferase